MVRLTYRKYTEYHILKTPAFAQHFILLSLALKFSLVSCRNPSIVSEGLSHLILRNSAIKRAGYPPHFCSNSSRSIQGLRLHDKHQRKSLRASPLPSSPPPRVRLLFFLLPFPSSRPHITSAGPFGVRIGGWD